MWKILSAPDRERKVKARCDCGTVKRVLLWNIEQGRSKSCGCAVRTAVGMAGITPTYKTWDGMKQRCFNPDCKDYPRYGGRGIKVCARWMDYRLFFLDMGTRPAGMTIDRINTDGHYEPGNCRWATSKQQSNNRRNNRRIAFRGEALTIAEWAQRLGWSRAMLRHRIESGWTVEQALTMPKNHGNAWQMGRR